MIAWSASSPSKTVRVPRNLKLNVVSGASMTATATGATASLSNRFDPMRGVKSVARACAVREPCGITGTTVAGALGTTVQVNTANWYASATTSTNVNPGG